ncbi:MAG: GGDEF domain-containing protein [bacterium]
MTRLIKNELFFYSVSLVFTVASIYVGEILHYQIALWGIFAVFNLYLHLLEDITPPLPVFLPLLNFVSGGIFSPLMPLLFISLPLVLWHKRYKLAPYAFYVVFSLLTLVFTGDFENTHHFSVYIIFLFSALLTYLFMNDYISKIFTDKPWTPSFTPSKKDMEANSAKHPLSVLHRYMKHFCLIDSSVKIHMRLIQVENSDTGYLDISEADCEKNNSDNKFIPRTIPLKGFLHRAATHPEEIHILKKEEHLSEAEKASLSLLGKSEVRTYMPFKLFEKTPGNALADYIVTADCEISPAEISTADSIEKFKSKMSEVRDNISYLLRAISSYSHIKKEIQIHTRISEATARILESFDREKLLKSVAVSLFNIFTLNEDRSVVSVLISEYKNNRHDYHLFVPHRTGAFEVNTEDVQREASFEVPGNSVHEMMLRKKLPGKYSETPPPGKSYPVFTSDKEIDRKKLSSNIIMHSCLIKNRTLLGDEKTRTSLKKNMPRTMEKAFQWSENLDNLPAWELYLEHYPKKDEALNEENNSEKKESYLTANKNADYAANRISELKLQKKQTPEKGTLSIFFSNYKNNSSDKNKKNSPGSEDKGKEELVMELIARVVSSALENIEMFEEKMEDSNIDGLTHLYNRRYLQDKLPEEFQKAVRNRHPLSAVMLDIDKFKNVNDTYGHKVGDDAIVALSKIVSSNTRDVDMAVRYGGEEFIIILHNANTESARNVAEMLRKKIAGVLITVDEESQKKIGITSSFGVSSYNPPGEDEEFETMADNPEDLIKTADLALYHSKRNGRNRVTVYTEELSENEKDAGSKEVK